MSSDEEDISDMFFMDTEASAPACKELPDEPEDSFRREPQEATQSVGVEDVDDGADQLIEMRGDGRYFGKEDEQGPTCRTCHKRGHMAKDCKVMACYTCGAVEDHYTSQCTAMRKCSNCGESGHLRADCTKNRRTIYCWRCESKIHTEDNCHLIWRDYVKERRGPHTTSRIFCYHCGKNGHYGDECAETSNLDLRFKEPSAFSGGNLPRGGRVDMQNRYFDDLEREKRRGPNNGSSNHPKRMDGNTRREKREKERRDAKTQRKADKAYMRGESGPSNGGLPKPQSSGYIPPKSQFGPIASDSYGFNPKLKQNHDQSHMFRDRVDNIQPTRSGHYKY